MSAEAIALVESALGRFNNHNLIEARDVRDVLIDIHVLLTHVDLDDEFKALTRSMRPTPIPVRLR